MFPSNSGESLKPWAGQETFPRDVSFDPHIDRKYVVISVISYILQAMQRDQGKEGIAAQLLLLYDVERSKNKGEIQVISKNKE